MCGVEIETRDPDDETFAYLILLKKVNDQEMNVLIKSTVCHQHMTEEMSSHQGQFGRQLESTTRYRTVILRSTDQNAPILTQILTNKWSFGAKLQYSRM